MIRVCIYEDLNDLRELLSETVRGVSELLLVNAYPNAKNILENTRRDKPDVILMDIQMPGMSGIEAVQLVKQKYPTIQVLMQTVFEDNTRIFAAICAGASGYILKDSSPERYVSAIIDTYQGGSPMSPSIARKVLTMFKNQNQKVTDFIELTDSEQKVLELLVRGLSYKLIADELKISYPTVNFHLKNIYRKLHVNSATEAISLALQNKLV
jgi:two-component system, NarL family, response regulator LiaR